MNFIGKFVLILNLQAKYHFFFEGIILEFSIKHFPGLSIQVIRVLNSHSIGQFSVAALLFGQLFTTFQVRILIG